MVVGYPFAQAEVFPALSRSVLISRFLHDIPKRAEYGILRRRGEIGSFSLELLHELLEVLGGDLADVLRSQTPQQSPVFVLDAPPLGLDPSDVAISLRHLPLTFHEQTEGECSELAARLNGLFCLQQGERQVLRKVSRFQLRGLTRALDDVFLVLAVPDPDVPKLGVRTL